MEEKDFFTWHFRYVRNQGGPTPISSLDPWLINAPTDQDLILHKVRLQGWLTKAAGGTRLSMSGIFLLYPASLGTPIFEQPSQLFLANMTFGENYPSQLNLVFNPDVAVHENIGAVLPTLPLNGYSISLQWWDNGGYVIQNTDNIEAHMYLTLSRRGR